jgi:hypothetical protein
MFMLALLAALLIQSPDKAAVELFQALPPPRILAIGSAYGTGTNAQPSVTESRKTAP